MTPDQLTQWRTSKGFTRPQMAVFIGIPETTYKNWERGDKQPTGAALRLLELVALVDTFNPELLINNDKEASLL